MKIEFIAHEYAKPDIVPIPSACSIMALLFPRSGYYYIEYVRFWFD